MDNPFIRLWKYGKTTFGSLSDPGLDHSCAIRILNALTFIIVITCLGLWITVFLLMKDRLFTGTFSGNTLTNLTCLTFFGGLVIAIFVGALAGNSLRRAFWKMLIRRRKY
jgi:hypothetical protein